MMTRLSRVAVIHVVLVAMLVRALVPAGWMPGTMPSHAAALVVCPMEGGGQMTMADGMAMDHNDQAPKSPDQDHSKHQTSCPYAMTSHWVPPAVSAVPIPSGISATVAERPILIVARERLHLPQIPRAPPGLA